MEIKEIENEYSKRIPLYHRLAEVIKNDLEAQLRKAVKIWGHNT
jgi:hypothetical protein